MQAIGISTEELDRRPRLFGALGELLDVRFVGIETRGDVEGVLFFGGDEPAGRLPSLRLTPDGAPELDERRVAFTRAPAVDVALRDFIVSDGFLSADPGACPDGWLPLALAGGRPVWAGSPGPPVAFRVGASLPELAEGETLRDRIAPGRCLGLVALLTFIRALFPRHLWEHAAPGACFVLDDPNLRALRYGFVDYRALVASAAAHDYHVSFAHIPLDLRFSSRRAVALFAENRRLVSLSIHGNTHDGAELGRATTEAAATTALAQALGRVERFERVHRLSVDRVMVPPHEATTEAVVRLLPAFGFEAVTMTRAHGFLYPFGSASPYAAPGSDHAGFGPTDLVGPGLPVLTRAPFPRVEDIPLRGFLRQPIVFYGHAEDLRDGLGVLEELATSINRVPAIRWGSLQEVARRCYATNLAGDGLRVRPFARRLEIEVPPDVAWVDVEPLGVPDGVGKRIVLEAASSVVDWSTPDTSPRPPVDGRPTPAPRAVARRVLTEGRDRLQPFARRVRSRQAP